MKGWRGLAAGCSLIVLMTGEAATAGPGEDAFQRRDYAAAAGIWSAEAREGSAAAMFGLGLLSDLGLGQPRNPDTALEWYLQAAELGLTDAQFNVGVLYDAGIGTVRRPVLAAKWYALAAVKGHARARYNLGLIYAEGAGIPRNDQLARYWLTAAAEDLSAAQERLDRMDGDQVPTTDAQPALTPPAALGAIVIDSRTAELAWAASTGPEGSRFLVELARAPAGEDRAEAVYVAETEASAAIAPIPEGTGDPIWRVSRMDAGGTHYAATPWQGMDGQRSDAPDIQVSIEYSAGSDRGETFARHLAAILGRAGIRSDLQPSTQGISEARLTYRFHEDRATAERIASFLPGTVDAFAAIEDATPSRPGQLLLKLPGEDALR
ncbi:tetratricopeptide repeat protein [Frigidibacter sp. MR17.14]|uniref:tetratricopeptide repeat protein n=1 Tax=Frigidibacter sp. MR17.14 TaxID=3126509 RepID=UPI00301308DC